MIDALRKFDNPWINRALLALLIWFVRETYTTVRSDIATLKEDIGNIKMDVKTVKREVELIENFNMQPK